jgi:hypothetical protein
MRKEAFSAKNAPPQEPPEPTHEVPARLAPLPSASRHQQDPTTRATATSSCTKGGPPVMKALEGICRR